MFESLITLITLTAIETILSIDNILFINILTNNINDKKQRLKTRVLGIWFAFIIRIGLLINLLWLNKLTITIINFHVHNFELKLSFRDIILILGGLFLIYKTITEIVKNINNENKNHLAQSKDYKNIILQIIIVDLVFSIDSIITAIGLTDIFWIIVIAMVISSTIMLVAAEKISIFVKLYPRLNIICLCFLIIVGLCLILEGFHIDLSKNYLYSALGFTVFVEFIDNYINQFKNNTNSPNVKINEHVV